MVFKLQVMLNFCTLFFGVCTVMIFDENDALESLGLQVYITYLSLTKNGPSMSHFLFMHGKYSHIDLPWMDEWSSRG